MNSKIIKLILSFLILSNIGTGYLVLKNTWEANRYVAKYDSLASANYDVINNLKKENEKLKTKPDEDAITQKELDDILSGKIDSKPKEKEKPKPKEREKPKPREVSVYVCLGGSAYAYHSSSYCSGLNRCSADIVPVSLSKAQSMGRRPCRRCY